MGTGLCRSGLVSGGSVSLAGRCDYRHAAGLVLPGINLAASHSLQYSIVALGFCLPVQQVAKTGLHSLSVSLVTLSVAFSTAIAAIIPVLEPEDHEMAYALSTIFLFNIVAVIMFPILGKAL